MGSALPYFNIHVFAGQGTLAVNNPETRQQALRDAELPPCDVLLAACYDAFLSELSSLPPDDFDDLELKLSDFPTKRSLLELKHGGYSSNPVVTGPTLFLVQTLRYFAFMEGGSTLTNVVPFADTLDCSRKNALTILGFSSGILPACVVASSTASFDYISRAIGAYKLALWIGVRTQLYRKSALRVRSQITDPSLPWSLVFFGLTHEEARDAVEKFNKNSHLTPLYVTAVMDTSAVTISGHPSALTTFAGTFGPEVIVHQTTVDTLYHAPLHSEGVCKQVLDDVVRRRISFAEFADLHTPVRSTFTGGPIAKDGSGSLIEVIVDLLLAKPVNWHLTVRETLKTLPERVQVRLLNIGPGAGLARSLEKSLSRHSVSILDLTGAGKTGAGRLKAPKQEAVAIVGMAVHMPGAMNASQLWEVLERGVNTISEIPEYRFKVSDYDGRKNAKGKRTMKAHTGNFIDGVDEFDNQFFRISPREAKSMDPQQRILLHAAYEALEDAGYVPNSAPANRPDRFGCFVGVATHDYVHNLRDDIDVYYSTGTLSSFLSGRLSYAMQMSGPSMVVDTACSSSLVAVYQGARALMNRDCDAALVGGVNVISSPDMFLGLDRGHFLSPTGQCKSFDSSADGYSRSEGCGVFVLKRLSDAINENDHILGVIRGIEVNHSGLAQSITHPYVPTQASLFDQLLENSGINSQRVNVVEAHGTGTQAGDPCEIESLRRCFGKQREANNPLYVSSIKANIGHLEAASGSAGLAKLLLMLKHGKIPQQISLKNLNPRISNLERDNIIIPLSPTPWQPAHQGQGRIAVLNNFGASGSNAALLLEEFSRSECSDMPHMSFVFGLSAKTQNAAEALRDKYVKWISSGEGTGVRLADMAYTATARRQLYEYRLAVSANSKEDLIKKLENAKVVRTEERDAAIVFVFSGQGSQYLGMGNSLYATSTVFRRHIDECHAILVSAGFSGILPVIVPDTSGSGVKDDLGIDAYQTALFSIEYGLAMLWMSWGVKPAAVMGHSLGEYAAMVIAGVLSLHGALTIVANRARLMVQKCAAKTTGMIAVNLGSERVQNALNSSGNFSKLTLACYNGPTDCVVSGPLEQLQVFKAYLDSHFQCKNTILSVPFGFHSAAMESLVDDLTSIAETVAIRAPSIPIVSNLHGRVVLPGDKSVYNARYFSRHCVEPVRFESGIDCLLSELPVNVDTWIEIGPHTTTLPMLKSNPSLSPNSLFLASINKRHDAWVTLTSSLSSLYMSGTHILWRQVFSHVESIASVSLPSYPFMKSKFWVSYNEPKVKARNCTETEKVLGYRMLHSFVQYPSPENGHAAVFETPISQLSSFIAGHCVGDVALCPASVYIEQVFAGLELSMRHLGTNSAGNQPILRDIEFSKPLVYHETVKRTVITTIKAGEPSGSFTISSRVGASEESVHCRGQYRLQQRNLIQSKFDRVLPVVERRIAAILRPQSGKHPEMFSTRTVYDVIFPRVVKYSKEYQTMKSLCFSSDAAEGCAKVAFSSDHGQGVFSAHPIFVDTLLHVAGFVANMQGGANDAYICSEVGAVKVFPDLIKPDASYTVYCNNASLPEQNVIIADAYAVTTTPTRKVVAYLKGMQFRRTRLRAFIGLLNAASGVNTRQTSTTKGVDLSLVSDKLHASKFSYQSKPFNPDVSSSVIAVVAETCNLDRSEVKRDSDLTALGIDSLMSIEISQKLREAFPDANVDSLSFSRCRTIQQLVDEIRARFPSHRRTSSATSTAVSPSSHPSSPRTLVHEDPPQSSPSLNEELNIKAIISFVLDISIHEVEDDQELESIGLDSLTSIEALHILKEKSGLDLPTHLFHSCKTVRALQEFFTTKLHPARKSSEIVPNKQPHSFNANATLRLESIPSLLQQPTLPSNRTPLFLIHDGSGLTNYYERLPPLDRQVWVVNNPHFETAEPWESIPQMASDYADRLHRHGQRQVILGGWSFGGVVAYETSMQLRARGIDVKGIILIDAPEPFDHVPLSDSLISAVVNLDGSESEIKRRIRAQFTMNSRLLAPYHPRVMGGSCPPMVFLRSKEGFRHPSDLEIPRWLSDRSDPESATQGWRRLSNSRVTVFDIPGDHFSPFNAPNVIEVSLKIQQALGTIDKS